ncbi:MAG: roadblock/LC7 domain-containing protein [Polyangiaceae bacterium]|jgi:hypothetical protein
MSETPFAAILGDLVRRVPGGRAAALVDAEGETVDHAGGEDAYAIRVAAAHWRIVLDEARTRPTGAACAWIAVHAAEGSAVMHALPSGYAIVLLLFRGASFSMAWNKPLAACVRRLAEEAGWPPPGGPPCYAFDVLTDPDGRPARIRTAKAYEPLEVIGRLVARADRHETGWRVRTRSGVETTLIREPGGFWYGDEPIDSALANRFA